MNRASMSYETTWDNLQVHGTAIAEKREGKQQWQMEEEKVQAEAGVKDHTLLQTQKFIVTRAQRPDRWVGT